MLPLYKNPNAPEEERVSDLLSQMTIDEKLGQMYMHCKLEEIKQMIDDASFPKDGICATYMNRNTNIDDVNKIQRHSVENTRLGIPVLIMGESLHGVMFPGATVFPQSIGIGSTFNIELMHDIANTCGKEANALGIRQTYAPNLDLARDPRWGRVEETFGEDPYLVSKLGTAYVKALQGNNVAASPKHYIAYGSPEGGINLAPTHIGERELRENMLEPFRTAICEGKAMSIMPSYGEVDGIPVHGSRFLLTELLRDELGFDGFVVADFGAVTRLHMTHNTAETLLEAGKQSLIAGCDLEAGQRYSQEGEFLTEVRNGTFPIEYIDIAVKRILRIKFRLGLFENPYATIDYTKLVHTKEAIALAKAAAEESIVLLKNDNTILPLSSDFNHIAVIGPNAYTAQLGDYTVPDAFEKQSITLKSALTKRFGEKRILCAEGCGIARSSEKLLSEAVVAAKKADVAIIALGDNSSFYGGIGWGDSNFDGAVTCGEGFDVSSLHLPKPQRDLFNAVVATGTPVVLVLVTGRPYCIGEEVSKAKAVLQAWYPGEQGGNALCNILFGNTNPSGKLPISFPRSTGHIPCFYNHKPSARGIYKKPGSLEKAGRDYVFDSPDPLYPFGYGLSYTTFAYSDLTANVDANGNVSVCVTVKNCGEYAGKETVMLFLKQCFCPVTPFVKRLRSFEKIYLEVSESKTVTFDLNKDDFTFINEQMKTEVGKGKFVVYIDNLRCEFNI